MCILRDTDAGMRVNMEGSETPFGQGLAASGPPGESRVGWHMDCDSDLLRQGLVVTLTCCEIDRGQPAAHHPAR
jgi:hypothetical protein